MTTHHTRSPNHTKTSSRNPMAHKCTTMQKTGKESQHSWTRMTTESKGEFEKFRMQLSLPHKIYDPQLRDFHLTTWSSFDSLGSYIIGS